LEPEAQLVANISAHGALCITHHAAEPWLNVVLISEGNFMLLMQKGTASQSALLR
jgi:hypothetical protein